MDRCCEPPRQPIVLLSPSPVDVGIPEPAQIKSVEGSIPPAFHQLNATLQQLIAANIRQETALREVGEEQTRWCGALQKQLEQVHADVRASSAKTKAAGDLQ